MAAYSTSFFLILGLFHATIVLQIAHQSIHTGIYLTLPTILFCFRWVIDNFICTVADDDDDDDVWKTSIQCLSYYLRNFVKSSTIIEF